MHPLVMAFVEAELGESCLLSALLAINLQPGETVQPWHFDDGGAKIPRPRPPLGISTFWAIDDTTELNGATEIIPGSHLWDGEIIAGAVKPADFSNRATERETSDRADAIKMTMPSGSLAITKGTLWWGREKAAPALDSDLRASAVVPEQTAPFSPLAG